MGTHLLWKQSLQIPRNDIPRQYCCRNTDQGTDQYIFTHFLIPFFQTDNRFGSYQ